MVHTAGGRFLAHEMAIHMFSFLPNQFHDRTGKVKIASLDDRRQNGIVIERCDLCPINLLS